MVVKQSGRFGNPHAVEADVGLPLRVCIDRIQPFDSQRHGGGGLVRTQKQLWESVLTLG